MLKLLLYFMSFFYGIGMYFRNRMYDLKILESTEFDIPVISVGNITVGGTGKTPHIEYLITLLKNEFNVVVLSRGYKRKTKGFREVTIGSTVEESGDEPLQIKNKFPETGVYVDEKRVHGIEEIIRLNEEKQPDVILLDDAFQHRSVTPGINILLVDSNRPITEDKLLPYGRLREGKTQVRRASMIIYTKCPREVKPITRRIIMQSVNLRPYQNLYFTAMEYGLLTPVFPENVALVQIPGRIGLSVLMVTGIAQPEPFKTFVSSLAEHVEEIRFPDHHSFGGNDLLKIEETFVKISGKNKLIVTTEKDATRLKGIADMPDMLKSNLFYIPIKIKFLDSEGKSFDKKILDYVRENKSNRELYKRKDQRPH
ncbi:MAG: tetraacyldisaccharide 4'-kinase [Bacteroidetes bacterium GWF2_42_66]|nr:MAG: tetraacyldisaccharide 4'-kinase [Bacteroidetes bacterium GWA2_42_15]OFX96477.1 MAG: tetraacyldisaccharide 4'-kinase [Bacteroidetes bacterium GWE2_42_39]OFY40897.1 MAG: tetraacyldisaccharide 4'-kinase [Bacteroidetes bacterium GWF2_42_66]HBL76328.1 tetraacyldisaccharide 4'-kinase [Prolixibacteraceae bacterium]HCR92118.1 tetraacyldisaccharide 4'-kinase [Prolixibacteraceae bacterium]